MNIQPTATSDLYSPLPGRQLRRFTLFFLVVVFYAFAATLYSHFHRAKVLGWADAALVGLVLIQVLLFCLMVIPVFPGWPAGRWFRDLLVNVADPTHAKRRPHPGWWWVYFVASVAVVLAECRIEPAFGWGLVVCAGPVCMLPLRTAMPASAAIVVAFLFNKFGWSKLATWDVGDWVSAFFNIAPFIALMLFFGRTVAISGQRGRLILELEKAKRELELARQRDAELAALRERERLARDLHDNLGHSLVTMTVQLEAAQRLISVDPARAAVALEEMKALSRSSMESLRRSLANLRAPGLGDKPLTQALQSLTDVSRRTGLKVDCQIAEGADGLPPAVAETLWHVAQEGLTNVQKHAQAQHAAVSLSLQPQLVVLRVSDDGVGLPPDAERKPGHYGLRGMRERVEGVGGTFLLTTATPRGTIVQARVPLIA